MVVGLKARAIIHVKMTWPGGHSTVQPSARAPNSWNPPLDLADLSSFHSNIPLQPLG